MQSCSIQEPKALLGADIWSIIASKLPFPDRLALRAVSRAAREGVTFATSSPSLHAIVRSDADVATLNSLSVFQRQVALPVFSQSKESGLTIWIERTRSFRTFAFEKPSPAVETWNDFSCFHHATHWKSAAALSLQSLCSSHHMLFHPELSKLHTLDLLHLTIYDEGMLQAIKQVPIVHLRSVRIFISSLVGLAGGRLHTLIVETQSVHDRVLLPSLPVLEFDNRYFELVPGDRSEHVHMQVSRSILDGCVSELEGTVHLARMYSRSEVTSWNCSKLILTSIQQNVFFCLKEAPNLRTLYAKQVHLSVQLISCFTNLRELRLVGGSFESLCLGSQFPCLQILELNEFSGRFSVSDASTLHSLIVRNSCVDLQVCRLPVLYHLLLTTNVCLTKLDNVPKLTTLHLETNNLVDTWQVKDKTWPIVCKQADQDDWRFHVMDVPNKKWNRVFL